MCTGKLLRCMHTENCIRIREEASLAYLRSRTRCLPVTRATRGGSAAACSACGAIEDKEPADQARRAVLLSSVPLLAVLLHPGQGQASALPAAVDRAWEAIGGGPADLYFPPQFLGAWGVESTLVKVELPLGPDFVPDLNVVARAQREDLNKPIRYRVAYARNAQGNIVLDRAANTASLMDLYLGPDKSSQRRIEWDMNNPNVLTLSISGGLKIRTRVTRRSEDKVDATRLDTSEFFEQVFDARDEDAAPKVKASQCFTKYKWRDEGGSAVSEGGPAIVATQVVSDYLTPYDGEAKMMAAQNRPVVKYTYRLAFRRLPGSRVVEA